MCCGLTKSDFMVRVGPHAYEKALREPHARPMDFTGRPLTGMVYVAPSGLRTRAAVGKWVNLALAYLAELPVTKKRPARSKHRTPKR